MDNNKPKTQQKPSSLDKSESDMILKRVQKEGGLIHLDAPSNPNDIYDEETDPASVWGKRVGRGLGFVFLAYLIYSLWNKVAG